MGASFQKRRQHTSWMPTGVSRRCPTDERTVPGATRHEWSGNHFVEFGQLDRARRGVWPLRWQIPRADQPLAAAAAPARRLPTTTAGLRATAPDCRRHSPIWRGWTCRPNGPRVLGRDGADLTICAANHALIHAHIARELRCGSVLLDIENHHNSRGVNGIGFRMDGRRRYRASKGATPAGAGVLGLSRSMGRPGYVVRGKGRRGVAQSASHGAGRKMSRTRAKKCHLGHRAAIPARTRVTLLSAGLDEVPMVYKDITRCGSAGRLWSSRWPASSRGSSKWPRAANRRRIRPRITPTTWDL